MESSSYILGDCFNLSCVPGAMTKNKFLISYFSCKSLIYLL